MDLQTLLHLPVQLRPLLLVLVVLEVRLEEPDLVVDVAGLLQKATVLQLDPLLFKLQLLSVLILDSLNLSLVPLFLLPLALVPPPVEALLDYPFLLLRAGTLGILDIKQALLLL